MVIKARFGTIVAVGFEVTEGGEISSMRAHLVDCGSKTVGQ
jgi:hypothetical protein